VSIFIIICILPLALLLQIIEKNIILNIIKSFVLISIIILLSSETLSLFHFLNSINIRIFWILVFFILLYSYLRNRKKISYHVSFKKDIYSIITLFIVIFILFFTLFIALITPPNTYDAMSYHLPRVMQWSQNQGLDFFTTNNDRQLWSGYIAELYLLHFYLLDKTDISFHIIQWLSFFVTLLTLQQIIKVLGGNHTLQLATLLIASSIPMAILQSTSTQNDMVLATFTNITLLFALKLYQEDFKKENIIFFSFGIALALLVKGTAYIWIFVVLLVFGVASLIKYHKKVAKVMTYFFVTGLITVLLNFPFYYRNYQAYGNILGNSKVYALTNEDISLQATISNISKNIILNLKTPFYYPNVVLDKSNKILHQVIGVDINDPRYNFLGNRLSYNGGNLHEDIAENTLHVLLLLIAIPVLLFRYPIKKNKILYGILITIILNTFLFSLLLKWQYFHTRQHLALILMSSPILAYTFFNTKNIIQFLMVLLFFMSSLPFLLLNPSKPIFGEKNIFRTEHTDILLHNEYSLKNYKAICKPIATNKIKNIGLDMGVNDNEYAIWYLLKYHYNHIDFKIEHLFNGSKYSFKIDKKPDFIPDCIISLKDVSLLEYQNDIFEKVDIKHTDKLYLYTRR